MVNVFSPVRLPCGRSVQNRLVKVALYEHLASFLGGPPNSYHFALYSRWASYAWGMIITGNIQVSPTHLSLGRDMVIPETICEETIRPFRILAACIHRAGLDGMTQAVPGHSELDTCPLAIMQLSHAGRQSPNFIGGRFPFVPPKAPSDIAVGSRAKSRHGGIFSSLVHGLLFQTPLSMSVDDIDQVVLAFVRGARVAVEAGFDGVELHVAHGYLLTQFISPKTNKRTDAYSATPDNSLHLLRRIVLAIRAVVPKEFILGMKLNASDYADSKLDQKLDTADGRRTAQNQESCAIDHICTIASWGCIDFIEISGGDYENPEFMQRTSSESPRQAFFARFSHQVVKMLECLPDSSSRPPTPLILLTGGLRSPAHLHTALASRHADLLGIGRGAILQPNLPEILAGLEASSEVGRSSPWSDVQPFALEPRLDLMRLAWVGNWDWSSWIPRIPLVGAGIDTAWYVVAMRRWAEGIMACCGASVDKGGMMVRTGGRRVGGGREIELDYRMSGIGAVLTMWLFVDGSKVVRMFFTSGAVLAGGLLVGLLVISFLPVAHMK